MNILHLSGENTENIWNIVKSVRIKHFSEYIEDESASCDFIDRMLLPESDIENNLKKVGELLQFHPTNQIFSNVSKTTLETASEMFFYLILCPEPIVKSSWLLFYDELFRFQSLKAILLTLNRLLKTLKKDSQKKMNEKLIMKIKEKFQLQFVNIKKLCGDKDRDVDGIFRKG